jgi:hypothetical protein
MKYVKDLRKSPAKMCGNMTKLTPNSMPKMSGSGKLSKATPPRGKADKVTGSGTL